MGSLIPYKGRGPNTGNGAGLGKPFKDRSAQGDFIEDVANAVSHNGVSVLVCNETGAVMKELAGD